jgi:signal transduction histidine kinase
MFFAKTKEKIRRFVFSLKMRFTAIYLGLLAFTLIVFCSVLYSVFRQNHQQEFDAALYNHAVDVAQSITVDFFGDFVFTPNALLANEKVFPFSLGKSFVQVVSPDGHVLVRSPNLESQQLPLHPEDWQAVFRKGHVYRNLSATELKEIKGIEADANYRQIMYVVQRSKTLFILQIAVPTSYLERDARMLLFFFFVVGIPVTLILAGIGGLYLSSKALEPVREIVEKAKHLNPSNLSERLPEPNQEDEIHMLTTTLNDLLGRIQRAFESQEHFLADASHQLKTPLAILRGELDVFRGKTRSAEDMTAFLDSASQELEHLSRLVDDLLLLAKIDAGAGSLLLQKIRMDELLIDSIGKFELPASLRKIKFRFDLQGWSENQSDDEFMVNGDRDLLTSMFRNLLDNAVKYSPSNSLIEVALRTHEGNLQVEIKDQGEPIPVGVVERLFQRYERGGLRLGSSASGTGLGLPIARRIAELHGATISVIQGAKVGKSFRFELKKF